MSSSSGGGAAFDASAAVQDGRPEVPGRTAAQQKYLDNVAAAAVRGVEHTEATIADLQASLTERRTEAERARAEADNGRVDSEGGA